MDKNNNMNLGCDLYAFDCTELICVLNPVYIYIYIY